MILDAEIVGAWMAAHLVLKSPEVIEAVIYTDSQPAIRALRRENVGASPALVSSASLTIRDARRGAGGVLMRLSWCPGHAGIRGSEETDREARLAADGRTTRPDLLPRKVEGFGPKKNPKTAKENMNA